MPTFFYTSDMVGAPTNTDAAGSTLGILDACLVTGFNVRAVASASVAAGVMTLTYGASHGYTSRVLVRLDGAAGGSIVRSATVTSATQLTIPAPTFADGAVAGTLSTRVAPADWARPFSGTNIGVFRSKVIGPGSSRMFYRFQDTVLGGQIDLLRGYETMTDAETGTGPFPTFTQTPAAGGMRMQRPTTTTARAWFVVADERTVYLGLSDGGNINFVCIGDALPYNLADPFCAVAISGSDQVQQGRLSNGSLVALAFSPRAINGLGTAIQAAGIGVTGVASGAGGRGYPSPVDGGMVMIRPVPLCSGSSAPTDPIRGEMRGLLHCFANPLPISTFWQIFEPVTGVSGRVIVARDINVNTANCIALALDEVWP